MKNFLRVAAALAVVAVVGLASKSALAGPTPTAEVHSNKNTFSNLVVQPAGYIAWDFPALGDQTALQQVCAESASAAAKGCKITDACLAGSDLGVDGGSALAITAQLSCRALTDAVVFKLCNQTTDAGAYDLADAGFFGRCVH